MHQEAHTNNSTSEPAREALLKLRKDIEDRRSRAREKSLATSGYKSAVLGGRELAYDEAIRLINDHLIRADQKRL